MNGTQVQVSIDGVPVVGRMSSQDQAAMLHAGQTAHFVVKDLAQGVVTLQLLRPGMAAEGSLSPTVAADFAGRVLEQAGIAASPENMLAARALLCQGIEITPAALTELLDALSASGQVTEEKAALGASLMAAGIPVTPESLALFADPENVRGQLEALLQNLRAAVSRSDLFPGTLPDLQRALHSIERSIPAWDSPPALLAQQIRSAVTVLGRSLENLLSASVAQEAGRVDYQGGPSLFDLARLFRLVSLKSQSGFMSNLSEVLDGLRQSHLLNTGKGPAPSAGTWTTLDFLVRAPLHGAGLRRATSVGKIQFGALLYCPP